MRILCDNEKENNKEEDLVKGGDTVMNDSGEIDVPSSDSISNVTESENTASKQKKYHVGQHVRAIYSFDNEEYEGVITSVSQCKDTCVVKFVGYGNKEEVFTADLKKSQGKDAVQNQIVQARMDSQEILSDSEEEDSKEVDLIIGGDSFMNDSGEIDVASSDTISELTESENTTSKQKKYHVGQHVRAIYSFDNEEYEGVITSVSQCKDTCVVKFVGYGNKQEVFMADLKKSQGKDAVQNQIVQAGLYSQEILSDSEEEDSKEIDLINGGDSFMNDSSEIDVASSDTISNLTESESITSKQKILCDYEKEVNKEEDLVKGGDTVMNDSGEIDVPSSDSISNVTESENTASKQKKYHVGQHVRAIYCLDNQEYEAVITSVYQWKDTCVVKFVGYGNIEEVFMADLKKSQGKDAVENQIVQARMDCQEGVNLANIAEIWDDTELIELWDKSIASTEMRKYHVGQHVRAIYGLDNQEYEAVITSISQWKDTCVVKFVGYGNKEEVFTADLKKSQGKDAVENQIVQARMDSLEVDSDPFDNYKDEKNKMELEHEEPIAETRNVNFGLRSRPNKQVETDHTHYRPQIPAAAQFYKPPVVPSIIPPPLIHRTHSEQEAFTSLLMSWYLNGYHTGYYEGLNHDRKAPKSSMNKHRNPASYYTKK